VGQMMRRSPAEKREIIDLVEHSALPVGRTLAELDVPRSSFYRWYQQYQQEGEKGLDPQAFEAPAVLEPVAGGGVRPDRPASAGSAGKVGQAAGLAVHGPGRLFCLGTSVIRLLKRFDLVESPAFQLVTAADRFGPWPGRPGRAAHPAGE